MPLLNNNNSLKISLYNHIGCTTSLMILICIPFVRIVCTLVNYIVVQCHSLLPEARPTINAQHDISSAHEVFIISG
jgi:hypothetical protein